MAEQIREKPANTKHSKPVIRNKKGHVLYLLTYLALFYFGIEGLLTGHTDIIIPGLSDPEDAERQAMLLSTVFLLFSLYGISYCANDLYTATKKGK